MNSKSLTALAIAGLAFCSTPLFYSCSTTQPASEQMSDAGITSKIKAKFVGDPDVKALDVGVETEEGVVYLTGRVNNQQQKEEAERLAKDTKGVIRVVNHITVGDKS
jgi:hyperosmotically inducible periplasmic protein